MEFNYRNNIQSNQLNESNVIKIFKDLKKMSNNKVKTILKDSFKKFSDMLIQNNLESQFLNIFNKHFKTNYKSLKQVNSLKESILNEDFKNFLKFWKSETYPALAIFPTLQIWFQIDKLLDGVGLMDLDWKKIAIYGVLWIIIVTGQHMILFNKWKKENKEEWEAEGKPGIFKSGVK